jgi:hypothetical protein
MAVEPTYLHPNVDCTPIQPIVFWWGEKNRNPPPTSCKPSKSAIVFISYSIPLYEICANAVKLLKLGLYSTSVLVLSSANPNLIVLRLLTKLCSYPLICYLYSFDYVNSNP